MGIIYTLANVDAHERYDLDKWGNRIKDEVFPYGIFTLRGEFGDVGTLIGAMFAASNNLEMDDRMLQRTAEDVWDWAGPDAHLFERADVCDWPAGYEDAYHWPTTGSRMAPDHDLLRAKRAA